MNPAHINIVLLNAQVQAAREWPYMAPIIMRLRLELGKRVSTFATTPGLTTYVNRAFALKLCENAEKSGGVPVRPLMECLMHEALHVFLGYWRRQEGRDAMGIDQHGQPVAFWNVAHDLEIARYVKPPGAVTPQHFKLSPEGLAEAYYPWLLQNAEKVSVAMAGGASCCGNHEVADEKVSVEEASSVQNAVLESAVAVGREPGVEKGLKQRALEVLGQGRRNPVLAQLKGSVMVRGAHDYAYGMISRRQSTAGDIILPAMVRRQVKAGCVLDVSGSMEGQVEPATEIVLSVVRSVGVSVDVVAWDTKPQARANVRSAKDIAKLHWSGGGTDMGAAVKWLARRGRYDVIFVVTDGWTPWYGASEARRLPRVVMVGVPGASAPPEYIARVQL